MKIQKMIIILALAIVVQTCISCAAFQAPGGKPGLDETLGLTRVETIQETPLVDANGQPVLDDQGRQIVEVTQRRVPGPTLTAASDTLGGPWSGAIDLALAGLFGITGIGAIYKHRRVKELSKAVKSQSEARSKAIRNAADHAYALGETIKSINAAGVSHKVKSETASRLASGNRSRELIRQAANNVKEL